MSDNYIDLTDAKLVVLCRSGDDEAWREFIRRFGPLMYGMIHRFSLCSDDKDDVFGHVCLLILQNLQRLRRDDRIAAFVATTTYRECLARVREEHRRVKSEAAQRHIAQIENPAPDQEELVLRSRREHLLFRGIDLIEARCRKLIMMLFFEEPTPPYAEVAKRLGLTPSGIGPIRGRCLTRLRAVLKRLGFEKI